MKPEAETAERRADVGLRHALSSVRKPESRVQARAAERSLGKRPRVQLLLTRDRIEDSHEIIAAAAWELCARAMVHMPYTEGVRYRETREA